MDDTFSSLYALVASINETVEALPASVILKEDGRKIARCAKRVETVMFDLQPYVGTGTTALREVLQEVESALMNIVNLVREIGIKGPLASFLQADRMLGGFQQCCRRLDNALGSIKGRLPQETSEELAAVRGLLQRTRFELAPKHGAVVAQFREGVDRMVSAHGTMMDACGQILLHVTGASSPLLGREALENTLRELMSEHALVCASGDPNNDAAYLRTMMDVLRLYHRTADVPVAYTCPLTNQVMQEPATVLETGMSYERTAIEEWHKTGHRICPRSGKKLGWRLTLVPNNNLKDAIEEWRLFGALSVAWQPVLQQLTLGDELQDIYAQAARSRALSPSTSSAGEHQGPTKHSASGRISQEQPGGLGTSNGASTAAAAAAAQAAGTHAMLAGAPSASDTGVEPLGLNVPSPVVRGSMTQPVGPLAGTHAQDDRAGHVEGSGDSQGVLGSQGNVGVIDASQQQNALEQDSDAAPDDALGAEAAEAADGIRRVSADSSNSMQAMAGLAVAMASTYARIPSVACQPAADISSQNAGELVDQHRTTDSSNGQLPDVQDAAVTEVATVTAGSTEPEFDKAPAEDQHSRGQQPEDDAAVVEPPSSEQGASTSPAPEFTPAGWGAVDVTPIAQGVDGSSLVQGGQEGDGYVEAAGEEGEGEEEKADLILGKAAAVSDGGAGAPALAMQESFDMFAGLGMHSPGLAAQQPSDTSEGHQQPPVQTNGDDQQAATQAGTWGDASFDALFEDAANASGQADTTKAGPVEAASSTAHAEGEPDGSLGL